MWQVVYRAPSGVTVQLDPDRGGHDTDVAKFERQYCVKPGDQYSIIDQYSDNKERYIYLGSLWSLCVCSGGQQYISPSNHPHWYTRDPAQISQADITAAILYVADAYEPDLGYEMEA